MTFAQTREFVLKVLRFWNVPVNTVTQIVAENNGSNLTVQILLDAARRLQADSARPLTERERVVLSPEFVQRYAETPINPQYYSTVTVTNGSPALTFTVHHSNPE